VIRNHSDVSDEMRAHVLRVIGELDYRPSAVARALVSGRSNTIGLLISDIANPFYPQLAKSIEREAAAQGYALVICNTDDNVEESVAYVRRLIDQGVEGVIHASVGLDEEEVLKLLGDPRRIVFTNRRPKSRRVSYVVVDNAMGAAAATRHLLEAGHRRLGFVGGPSWAANARERRDGFMRTVRDAGAEAVVYEGDFTADSGAAAVREWVASKNPPTAVIGVNDSVALGVIGELATLGSFAPRMAVAGFDDIDLAGLRIIGLTSVAQHIGEMGERSARLLLRQLAGKSRPPVRQVLQPVLHARRTTTLGAIDTIGDPIEPVP
jgi:LacI family transcriptional regulator